MEPNPNANIATAPAEAGAAAAQPPAPQPAPAPKPKSRFWKYLPAVLAGAAVGTLTYLGLRNHSQFSQFRSMFVKYGTGKGLPSNIEADSPVAQAMAKAFDPATSTITDTSIVSQRTSESFSRFQQAEVQKDGLRRFKGKMSARNTQINNGYLDRGIAGGMFHTVKNTVATAADVVGTAVAAVGLPLANIGFLGVRGGLLRQMGAKQRAECEAAQNNALGSLAKDIFNANKKAEKDAKFEMSVDKGIVHRNIAFSAAAGIATSVVVGIVSQRLSARMQANRGPRLQLDGSIGNGQFTGNIAPRSASYIAQHEQEAVAAPGAYTTV